MFMAVKNLNALQTVLNNNNYSIIIIICLFLIYKLQFINETYPDSNQEQTIYFQFDEEKTEPQKLELVMNSEQHITAGWEVSPHTTPLTVRTVTQLEVS